MKKVENTFKYPTDEEIASAVYRIFSGFGFGRKTVDALTARNSITVDTISNENYEYRSYYVYGKPQFMLRLGIDGIKVAAL